MITTQLRWRGGPSNTDWTLFAYEHRTNTLEEIVDFTLNESRRNRTPGRDLDGKNVQLWAGNFDYEFRNVETGETVWAGHKTAGGEIVRGRYRDGTACDVSQAVLARSWVVPSRRRFRAA